MKKFILGLLVVLLITLNVVYIYNYEVVNKKLIEANQEKENLERVVEEKEKVEKKYSKVLKEKEKLSEEYLNNKQSLEVLLKQRENLEKQVSEYMEIMQYKPYFEGNKEFLTEKDQYHYNFFKMIEEGEEIEFDIFGTRIENVKLKRISDIIYYPVKSRLFDLYIGDKRAELRYNEEYIEYYDALLSEMSKYYQSLDVKKMTEKELIRAFSRKIANDFSYDKEHEETTELFHASAMGILEGKEVVCTGYTHMLRMLLDMAHIQNAPVLAYMPDSGNSHIWNQVTLSNGEIFYVDLTWADFESGGVYDEFYILNKSIDFNDGKRDEITVATIKNVDKIKEILYKERH